MRTLKLVLACLMTTSLMACNTISGIGQDLQNLGTAVDKNSSKKSDSANEAPNSGVVVTPVR
jgi:predicted small secreted protein